MKIGEILRKARIDRKETMSTVEKKTGILAANQSKIELGANESPGFMTISALAKYYNLSLDALSDASQTNDANPIIAAQTIKNIYIPVLNTKQIASWIKRELPIDDDILVISSPWQCSKTAFAMKVNSESMTASHGSLTNFPYGSTLIIDPEIKEENRSFVVIKLKKTNEILFKQLMLEGDQKYLKSINQQYPIIVIEGGFEILGVVIGKIEKIST